MDIVNSKSRTRNYIKGLLSNYILTFATIIVGFWLVPFTLRYLTREEYAITMLCSDVLMWLGLLDIGLTSVLNVKVAQQTGKPDQQLLNALASTTFFSQLCITFLFILIGSIFAVYFPIFFELEESLKDTSKLIMLLMALSAAIMLGTQTFSSLLIAHQQIHYDSMIRVELLVIRTILTVILLINGTGVISFAIAHLVATVLASIHMVIQVKKMIPGLKIHIDNFSGVILMDTARSGLWLSLAGIAGLVIMNFDRIITAKLISVGMVTTLSLTGKLYAIALTIVGQITRTARPALAQVIGEGKIDLAREKYRQLVSISTGVAILLSASLLSVNKEFVGLWVGKQHYGGIMLDALLSLNLIIHSWLLPSSAILMVGLVNFQAHAVSRFIEAAVNFVLSIVLGLMWGIQGIIAATAIASICTTSWFYPYLITQYFNTSFIQILNKDVIKLIIFLIVMALTSYTGRFLCMSIQGILGIFSGLLFSIIIGLALLVYLLLDSSIKKMILNRVKKYVPA